MASFKASHTWSTIDLYGPNGPRVHPPAIAIGTLRAKSFCTAAEPRKWKTRSVLSSKSRCH